MVKVEEMSSISPKAPAEYNIQPLKSGEEKRQFLLSVVQKYPGIYSIDKPLE
jgi:hypothetical protein